MTETRSFTRPDPPAGSGLLWGIRVLAVLATALSGYLLYGSLADAAPVGCGPDSGCDRVLDSQWARWLGVPVSAAALALYFAVFSATFIASPAGTRPQRRRAWLALLGLSLVAGGAAGWFLFVQLAWLSSVCPYCLAVHACGLLVLGLVVWGITRSPHRAALAGAPGAPAAVVVLAMAAVGTLIAGQMLSPTPAPRDVARVTPTPTQQAAPTALSTAPAGPRPPRRYVAPLGSGTLEVDLWEFPSLGPADAPRSVLLLADYTCKHCRELHGHMKAALARYPGQFFFTIIPVPMSAGCNPRIRSTHPDHQFACELARLGLAVWRAKPEAFAEMDEYLFSLGSETHRVNSGDVANARLRAEQLVGKDKLAEAWSDPWLEPTLKQGVDVYASLGGGVIPKRVFPRHTYSGGAADREQAFTVLERELGLTPAR